MPLNDGTLGIMEHEVSKLAAASRRGFERLSIFASHIDEGGFGDRLVVRIALEDDARQITRVEEVFFALPSGFHAHNDLLASAFLAMFSGYFRVVHFNFPISEHCAKVLSDYYRIEELAPIDPSLEPRVPGRYLGVSFSGGLDSVAMLTMLRERCGVDIRVITAEFDRFHRESVAYASYQRDVSCFTNFRRHLGDAFRFDTVVPILFADYADLYGFASGHTLGNVPLVWTDPRSSELPEYMRSDPIADAAGMTEFHCARCLLEPGILQTLVQTAPERVELGLHGTGPPGERKHAAKVVTLRYIYQRAGLALPDFLRTIDLPTRRHYTGVSGSVHLRGVWIHRFVSPHVAERISPRTSAIDWRPVEPLSLDFFSRYNSLIAARLPEAIRGAWIDGLRACGIEPSNSRDHDELEQVRRFILAVNNPENLTF